MNRDKEGEGRGSKIGFNVPYVSKKKLTKKIENK